MCDPVAGLVEVPCVKRNVIGAVNAVSAANMAVAGITSRIPVDEVIDAMGEVGDALPASLRETGLGGLAATPTGRQAAERIARADYVIRSGDEEPVLPKILELHGIFCRLR